MQKYRIDLDGNVYTDEWKEIMEYLISCLIVDGEIRMDTTGKETVYNVTEGAARMIDTLVDNDCLVAEKSF